MKSLSGKESEKDTERYLKAKVKGVGGRCIKFATPGYKGFPDRMCLFPDGVIVYVELKSEGKPLDPLQVVWSKDLTDLGFVVLKIDTKAGVDKLMEGYNAVNRTDEQVRQHKQHNPEDSPAKGWNEYPSPENCASVHIRPSEGIPP